MRVALAICRSLPEQDPCAGPLLDALTQHGHHGELLAWDDPDSDPGRFDACLLRATWNYHLDPDGFALWLQQSAAATRLFNPLELVLGNMHKGYLTDLERAGVPTVPTECVRVGESTAADRPVAAALQRRGWSDVVVKPAVSLGGADTRRFQVDSEGNRRRAEDFAARLLRAGRDLLIQPFVTGVETAGERSLVYLDGALSHTMERAAGFSPGVAGIRRVEATDAECNVGAAALGQLTEVPLYARVDLVRNQGGEPHLSELELIEPSLFLAWAPGSAEVLVEALETRVATP